MGWHLRSTRLERWIALWMGLAALLAVSLGGCGVAPAAQKYPTKAITAIVPMPAGGAQDTMGRAVCTPLADKMGVPITIVNKAGGNGIPGTLEALKAAPDGYTVLVDSGASSSVLVAWGKDVPFDVQGRSYLALATIAPNAFYVNGNKPWKTLNDFEESVRKDPASVTIGWMGGVAPIDVTMAQLRAALTSKGVDMSKVKMVTYAGGGELSPAVAGGHVDIAVGSAPVAAAAVATGKARAIAVAGDRRLKILNDTPTTAEQGWPSVNSSFWMGFTAPLNVPKQVSQVWADKVKAVMDDPALTAQWDKLGIQPMFLGGDDYKNFVVKELEMIKALPVK